MTDILEILRSDLVYRLGWALLHSLWQIALLASVLALLLTAFRRRSANLRYLAACAGLAAMFALPLVTYWIVPGRPASEVSAVSMPPGNPRAVTVDTVLPNAQPPRAALPSAPPPEFVPAHPGTEWDSLPLAGRPSPEPTPAAEPAAPLSGRVSQAVSPWMPWLVLAWFVGVFVLSVWHLGGWIALQRLKYLGTTAGSQPLARRLAELIERMQLRRPVRMFQSALVDVPAVIGWLRPVLLLPAAMLGEMSPPQIDAVLAHELAHIRRYDYLVNLLQTVVETLLFYHPAVWWLSRRIRIEREHCCDDAAVAVCGSSLDYAAALMAMEQGRVAPRLAVAAGGADRGGTALSRVRRVLNVSGHDPIRPQTSLLGVFTVVALVGLLAGYIATAGEPPQKPDQAAEQRPEEKEAGEGAVEPAQPADLKIEARVVGIDGKTPQRSSITFWKAVDPESLKNADKRSGGTGFGDVPHVWRDRATDKTWKPIHNFGAGDRATKEGLEPGDYRVTAYVGHGSPTMLAVSQPVHLDGSRKHTVVTLHMEDGPSLKIEVVDARTGKPIEYAGIRLVRSDGLPVVPWSSTWSVRPRGNQYTFDHLAPGEYTLEVFKRAYRYGDQEYAAEQGPIKLRLAANQDRQTAVKLKAVGPSEEEARRRWPWAVTGTVTDAQGRPLEGVQLRASCGMGTLWPTGKTLSDQQGNYTLRFGPGMRIRKDDGTWGAGTQAATIFASKSGYTEKNLCRQGGLLMGDKLPEKGDHWYGQRERVVVPGKPRRLDFVMVPAASLEGEVVDQQGKPIADRQISVRGRQMLPSTSVLAQGNTDREGRFRFEGIPANYGWWFSVAGWGRTQPVTFPGPGAYRVKLQLAHYARYNLNVVRITSVTDPEGKEVGDKLVGDDPSARPPVAEELQEKGRSYLSKMAAACRDWFGPPPAEVRNYEYRFRLGDGPPKTHRVEDASRAAGPIRQGITYLGTPHILASRPEKVVFRQVEVGQETILLRFLVQDAVKIAAGNGVSGPFRGYFSAPLREGLLVLDKTTCRPVRTDIGNVQETFSRYMGLGDGRFVPLAIRIEKGSTDWDWKFRVYRPGLWLLAESRTRDGEDRSERLVTVDEVKVNGKAAVPMVQDGQAAWGPVSNGLRCRLLPATQKVEVPEGQNPGKIDAYVTYELENLSDRPLKFLPCSTPLEDVYGTFRVSVPPTHSVTGLLPILIREAPGPGDFVTIPPGRKLSRRVRLWYDLSEPGTYKVSSLEIPTDPQRPLADYQRPAGHELAVYYAGDAEKAKQNPDNVWTGRLTSNTVAIRVVRPAQPEDVAEPHSDQGSSSAFSSGPVAWGQPLRGLQMGLGFRGQERPYRIGELVGFALYVRNVCDRPMELVDRVAVNPPRDDTQLPAPSFLDGQGRPLPLDAIPSMGFAARQRHRSLGAGETVLVGTSYLRLGPRRDSNDPDPYFSVEPGTYCVQQRHPFTNKLRITSNLRSGRLTLDVVPVGSPTEGKAVAWGPRVEGLQVRLRPNQMVWKTGTIPSFKAAVRNRGSRPFGVPQSQGAWCELQIDGHWYKWTGPTEAKSAALSPGQRSNDFRITAVDSWRRPQNREALQLAAGKHTVRVALTALRADTEEMDPVRVASNPVEIEIVADQPPAGGQKKGWGPAVQGVQVRLRADKRVWKAGETPTFKADIRNGAKSTLYDTRGRRTIYSLEFDGHWYTDPSRVRKRPLAIPAGGQHAGGGVLPLGPKNWRRTEPPRTLELTPGKHRVRVAFVGTLGAMAEAGGGKPVRALSNLVEIEIVADKPPSDAEKAAAPSVETFRKHVANLVLPQRDDPYVPSQKWLREHLAGAVPFLLETRLQYKDQFNRIPVVADLLFETWQQGLLSDQQKQTLSEQSLMVGWDLREAYPPGYASEAMVNFRGLLVSKGLRPQQPGDPDAGPFGPEGILKAAWRVELDGQQIRRDETCGHDGFPLRFPDDLKPGKHSLKAMLEVSEREGPWRHTWTRSAHLQIDPELKPESIVAPGSENFPQDKALQFVEGPRKQYAWSSGEKKLSVTAPVIKIETQPGFDMDIVARLPIEVEIDGKIFGKPHYYGGYSHIDGHSPPGRQFTFQPSPDVSLRPGKFRWRIALVPDLHWAWTEPAVDRLCNRRFVSPWYTAQLEALPDTIHWGRKTNGLQAGLGFDLQDRPHKMGELVSFRLYVRNVSDKTVELVDFSTRGWMPTVKDSSGKALPIAGVFDGHVQRRRQTLLAGRMLLVGTVELRLDANPQQRRRDPPHAYLKPGAYRVSQKYRFADDPEATWSGELTTGELALKAVPAEPPAEGQQTDWGPAVEGVQCRLEAEKPTWKDDEIPRLKAYVRHQTETRLLLSNHPSFGAQLEVDGHWHRWNGPLEWSGPSHGSSKFRTKDGQPLKITLDGNWKQVENKKPLQVDPGRHVVRFAWEGFAEKGPRQGPDQQREVVLLSNPVEITVLPDSPQPKPADVHPDEKDAAAALQRLGAILAADDQGRIHSVRLSRTAVSDAGLVHLKGLSGLKALYLDDTQVTDAAVRHIAGLAGLETLSLNYTRVGDAGLEHLKGLGQLGSLELLDTEVTAAGLRELKKALPGLQATVDPLKLSGLAELRGWRNSAELNGNYELISVDLLGPEVQDAWLDRLKDRHTLQDVCLDRRKITDAGLAHLRGLTELHTLYLSSTQVTDRGLEYLKDMKKLRWLVLAETQIGDTGLAHLKGLTNLESLLINGTQVTDAGLVHLKPLTKLTHLKLNDCQLSGAGLSHLRGLAKLTTLELNGTAVSDAGLVHVKPFVNLELLYLSHTSVTDAGLEHLTGLTKLRALEIEHAHVTDQGIKMLKLALQKASFRH